MLILGRRCGESIFIYPSGKSIIEVKLLGTRGRQASIGIQADPATIIMREEVVLRDEEARDQETS